MKTHRKIAALFLGAALMAAAPPIEALLKSTDQEKLGKLVTEYYDALAKKEGIAEAKTDLAEEITKWDEKLSKKEKEEVALLASPEDVEAIFAFSKVYDKSQRTGRVTDVEAPTFLKDSNGESIPVKYSYHAPKAYKASKGSVPLILIIPDDKDEPARCLDDQWLLSEIRNGAVIAAVQMPKDPSLWGVSGMGQMGGLETVMFALRDLTKNFAIDGDRVYLSGHGPGVAAAVNIANVFPHIFAGVIGRSGDMGETSPTNFRNLPCLFAGGGSNVSTFEAKARELNYESVTVNADARAEDVWTWIEANPRNANPAKISFAPTSQMGTSSYWVTASGYDLDAEVKPEITVEVDKAANRVEITSTGISTVTLWFNDAIVDLDRDVTVVCNGEEYTDTFGRSLSTALDQFFRSNDASRVYTTGKVYDLPEIKGN
jgi:hypothetical protein